MENSSTTDLERITAITLLKGQTPATVCDLSDTVEFHLLPVSSLRISRDYQRQISRRGEVIIRRIVSNFTWARFGVIIVAQTATQHVVIDGQHRAIAAATLGIDSVPCMVTVGSTPDQARDFVGINNDRVRVGSIDKFRARVAAGDEAAIRIAAMLANLDISTDVRAGYALQPRQTRAIAAVEKLVKVFGAGVVFTTLEVMLDAQPEQENLLTAFAIRVATTVVARVIDAGENIDMMAALLQDIDFDSIHIDALKAQRMFGGAVAGHGTKMLARRWNKGRKTGRITE